MRKRGGKLCVSIGEKPPKLDEKTRRKTGSSINEKPPNLDEKMRRKTDHLLLLQRVKNLQNLAKKTGRKIERCARLPNPGEYAEEELRDPCISEKPPNPVRNWGGNSGRPYLISNSGPCLTG